MQSSLKNLIEPIPETLRDTRHFCVFGTVVILNSWLHIYLMVFPIFPDFNDLFSFKRVLRTHPTFPSFALQPWLLVPERSEPANNYLV